MYVKIPCDLEKPLESILLEEEDDKITSSGIIGGNNEDEKTEAEAAGDRLPTYLRSTFDNPDEVVISTTPLKRMAPVNDVIQNYFNVTNLAGVYAHHISKTRQSHNQDQQSSSSSKSNANIRATCLFMACGLHSKRFYGDVYLSRLGYFVVENEIKLINSSIVSQEVEVACIIPDLRNDIILSTLRNDGGILLRDTSSIQNITDDEALDLPSWLTEASRNNYEDSGALSVLAQIMKREDKNNNDEDEKLDDAGKSDNDNEETSTENEVSKCIDASNHNDETNAGKTFITRVPLCLHCRRPADTLCPNCKGAYFCMDPKPCRDQG